MPGSFKPPDGFDFTSPDQWPAWRERFKRYRLASALHKEDEDIQISALVYSMGPEAENILQSFGSAADTFSAVVKKLDEYFIPKRNFIAERQTFEQRNQAEWESNEQYIRILFAQADKCDFADKQERLRDRLLAGMKDKELSKKIQLKALEESVTLDTVIQMLRNTDIIEGDRRAHEQAGGVQRVYQGRHQTQAKANHNKQEKKSRAKYNSYQKKASASQTCRYCGYARHDSPRECPARGKTCAKCGKRDHFAAVCLSKLPGRVTETSASTKQNEAMPFLGETETAGRSDWRINVTIDGERCTFKADSGADVNVLSRRQYEMFKKAPPLAPADRKLQSVGHALNIVGMFRADVSYKEMSLNQQTFYVIDTCENLLSRETCSNLGILRFVDDIQHDVYGETGLMKTSPVKLEVRAEAVPVAVTSARKIPIPLLKPVEEELLRMERDGIIRPVTGPTEWCSPMVPVKKAGGKVRITVDYKHLNKAVQREVFPIPTLEQLTSKFSGATLFSKLDAASGFYQLPLDERSSELTTFITPFGRKAFLRLPMGLNMAPECFQRKMEEMMKDLPGVICYMDDIVCYGDEATHDMRLEAVMQRIEGSGLKLNREKCELRKPSVVFLGMKISKEGLQVDEDKLEAVRSLKAPTDVKQLRSLLGVINHLGRFVPHVQETLKPLNDLLRGNTAWSWSHAQQNALDEVKKLLTHSPVLAFFDPTKETVVSADASSFGIGGCILQRHGKSLKPVAFCSRTLTDTETRYAQIEKELLGATWTCEKFHMFLSGLPEFRLELDHKPLIPLINSKKLEDAPLRCQRMLMRLMHYNGTAVFVPGKEHIIPDYLSRNPRKMSEDRICTVMKQEVFEHCAAVISELPASTKKLEEISKCQQQDDLLRMAAEQIQNGWKEIAKTGPLSEFFKERNQLSVLHMKFGPLIMNGQRLVIPGSMKADVLSKLHDDGHFGLNKCRERARVSVWWPGIGADLKQYLSACSFCQINSPSQKREPLLPTAVPTKVWSHIATDICHHGNTDYLVTVDILSRFLEIQKLPSITSAAVIERLKSLFSRYGIPDCVTSDGGTQYTSQSFREFASKYGFCHRITDPHMPSANGAAERAVRTAKWILKQNDPHLALLNYRATPIEATGCSPARLLMGRDLRTRLPEFSTEGGGLEKVRMRDTDQKKKMEKRYTKAHGARSLPSLEPGDSVRVKTDNEEHWSEEKALVTKKLNVRSYLISYRGATLRRNRRHLKLVSPAREASKEAKSDRAAISHKQDDFDYHVTYPTPSAQQHPSSQPAEQFRASPRVTRSGRVFG